MKVQLIGCSHHNSPIELRERLAFSPEQIGQALGSLRSRFPATEAVVLSTCNRVEVYTANGDPHGAPTHQDMAAFLAEFHGVALYDVFDDLFERTGEDAIRHLFTVAASLDSMVVGEAQILSQVKQAYQLATQYESTGPLTHGIFQAALKVARRVASETTIQQRRVSIPSVAIGDFASQIFERFDDKRVLLIGAGEMGQETIRYLQDEGATDVRIINRQGGRAAELAARTGGQPVAWEQLLDELVKADLVISTTGSSEPIVRLEDYRRIEAERFQRPLFILDLAVPRDFDPAIGDCLSVYLYSIDDLRAACQQNRRERDKELPAALRIIEQETERFIRDLHHQATGPIIQRLRQSWDDLKEDELTRLFNKLPELEGRSQDEVRLSFERLLNKLLHPPLESLRDEARQGAPHALVEALKRLFQLRD